MPATGADSHGYALPPTLSISMNATDATTMNTAPRTSSLCGRSCRGRRRSSTFISTSAAMPAGTLIQKIAVQWTCWARKPPNTGPHAPEVVNTAEKYA